MSAPSDRLPFPVVALLVGVSGFCALVYQVVWERLVRYNFGGDSISAAIVTGTFLLGLGVGAAVFGRWRRGAFAAFAAVQLAIGAFALASYYVLTPLARVLGSLFTATVADADGVRLSVVVGCVLFLLPPCVLLGGTSPLMFNCFVRPGAYEARTVGWLYGLNTAGAALGVLAAPLLFLNRLSLPVTLATVGAGSVLLGIATWLAGRRLPPLEPAAAEAGTPEGDTGVAPLAALAFVSGLVSLAYEVSLFRAFFSLNPSSAYNFSAVLMPFLLAIAVGSVLATRFRAYAPRRALRRVGWLYLGAVVAMVLGVVASALVTTSGLGSAILHENKLLFLALHALLLAVPLPLCLSGVLPLLLRLGSRVGTALPRTTGFLFLANAVGAFAGALLTQFVGFSVVGTDGVVILLGLVGALAGAWALARAGEPERALRSAALALPVAVAALVVPGWVWEVYTFGVSGGDLDRVEGTSGVAVIRWRPGTGGRLFVNGQYMSSLPDDPRHVQLVSFALVLPRRAAVLLLGLGAGGAVRELAHDAAVRRVDVVDWSHELPRLLEFPRARVMLEGALAHPKVRLCRCDARVAVGLYPPGTFDVVIDDLAEADWVGSTAIKSVAYFREVRRILKPDGVFVYRGNYAQARAPILAGLAATFPVVREHPRSVVLAALGPLTIDPRRVEKVLAPRRQVLGIPTTRYAEWLIDGLAPVSPELLQRTAPIRDDLPVYEYPVDPLRTLFGAGDRRAGGS